MPLIHQEKKVYFNNSVIFFVGPPGSGKSTFWNKYMKEYIRVNHVEGDDFKDLIKTVAKGTKIIEEEAAKPNPKAVVIDNTNCTKQQRQDYMKLAKTLGYKPIAFVFNVDKETAMFLDKSR